MIIVEKMYIADIPLLHIVNHSLKDKKIPLVIFSHGFTSAKEINLHYAYNLAEKGIRVVLPEALFHGERKKDIKDKELKYHFWTIVISGIKELNMIKEDFNKRELIDNDRIGMAGTSMGGMITLGALTQYEWIKAAVCLMGSPCYKTLLKDQLEALNQNEAAASLTDVEINKQYTMLETFDLSIHFKEKLQKRPLLLWHGEQDEVVPYTHTSEFYQEVLPMYEDSPERLRFIGDSAAGHKVTHEGIQALVEWFERYL